MFAELNNTNKVIKEGINTESMEFKKLKEFCGMEIKVDGFFFTDGNFGKQVVIVGAGYLINMPLRATEVFEKIINSSEMTEAVKKGKLKLTDIKMIDTKTGTTVAYTLTDC